MVKETNTIRTQEPKQTLNRMPIRVLRNIKNYFNELKKNLIKLKIKNKQKKNTDSMGSSVVDAKASG